MIYKQLPNSNLLCVWRATVHERKPVQLASWLRITIWLRVHACSHGGGKHTANICSTQTDSVLFTWRLHFFGRNQCNKDIIHMSFLKAYLHASCLHTSPLLPACILAYIFIFITTFRPNESTYVLLCNVQLVSFLSAFPKHMNPQKKWHHACTWLYRPAPVSQWPRWTRTLVLIGHIFHCRLPLLGRTCPFDCLFPSTWQWALNVTWLFQYAALK